jgi:hypothetical protein
LPASIIERPADPAAADHGDQLYRASSPALPADELSLAEGFLRGALPREAEPAHGPQELTWIDDDTPEGARLSGTWKWIDRAAEGGVKVGERAHVQTAIDTKPVQHFALGGLSTPIGSADTLFVWIRLDPASPAREVMIQWNDGVTSSDGGWSHRAYWGEDVIMFGRAGTPSRQRMGDLPNAGEWTRLEVPAAAVGSPRKEASAVV